MPRKKASKRRQQQSDYDIDLDLGGLGFGINEAINEVLGGIFGRPTPTNPQPPPKPDWGIKLPRPRTVAEIASMLANMGLQSMYEEHEADTVAETIHDITLTISTPTGTTKRVLIALTDFKRIAKPNKPG